MPIVDYKMVAKKSEMRLLSDPNITDVNKEHITSFLAGYNVTDARKNIFLSAIRQVIRRSEDLAREMHDRKKINAIFYELRSTYSPATYATFCNVTLRFVRWLNEGKRPKGFVDIRNSPAKAQIRALTSADMITHADIDCMSAKNPRVQIKAILATQLDGGFRPSEFADLNYGDVEKHEDVFTIDVNRGKTGPRTVYLYDSVPALDHWVRCHPTKNPNDPLWVQEPMTGLLPKRLKYATLMKEIKKLGRLAEITKPLDFYNFRHSAITLKKKEGMEPTWSCRNFGHNMEYYQRVYGRLSKRDDIIMLRKHKGVKDSEPRRTSIPNITCSRCAHVNAAIDGDAQEIERCAHCRAPLGLKVALDNAERPRVEEELAKVKEQFGRLSEKLQVLEKLEQYIDVKACSKRLRSQHAQHSSKPFN